MSGEDRFAPVFQRMIDQPDASLDALRQDAASFERAALEEEDGRHYPQAAIPYRGFLGFLLFDAAGKAVPLDQPEWVPSVATFDTLMDRIEGQASHGRLFSFHDDGGHLLFGLWAPTEEAAGWNLPPSVRHAIGRIGKGQVALLAGGAAEPISIAAAGFGLSPQQQRVVTSVIRTGSIRAAAAELGIAYVTAREAMTGAARRMSMQNTPAVIRAIVEAAFGIQPGDIDRANIISDMLGVTHRQARVALMISLGASREAAAQAIGTSAAVIKKELEALYLNFGLQSAGELARLMAEVQALRLFARSVEAAPGFLDPAIEPSRFTVRPNGLETIAWSDYGPASGKPVLIVHSNWSCRAVPRPLMTELQRRGWRPIAIDRAGYGATHLGRATVDDPFSQAVADTLQVLDACRIDRVPIIARCGAQFVHVLKSRAPDRVGPVVLVSPTPEASENGQRVGVVGAIKEAFARRPALIEFFFRIICSQLNLARVEQLTRAIVRGCETDEKLCDDPQFIRDRFRALRPFATGNFIGGVMEEHIISRRTWDFAPLEVTDWVILQGDQDTHNSTAEVESYWRRILPRTPMVPVEGGGRFMTSSHAPLVADQLEGLCAR